MSSSLTYPRIREIARTANSSPKWHFRGDDPEQRETEFAIA
jgi:hypothetical protein